MPYYISDEQSDCQGWATIKADSADATPETIGCHQMKDDAIAQMVAVSLSEELEPMGDWSERMLIDVDDDDVNEQYEMMSKHYSDTQSSLKQAYEAIKDILDDIAEKMSDLEPSDELIEVDEEMRAPAPLKDQIKGSDTNPEGSAADAEGNIELGAATETALQNKADEHNEKMSEADKPAWTRVTVGALRSVYRRGAGAFSTSHRPNMTRAQWAMARVNSFLYLSENGKPENSAYITDNDLLKSEHPKFSNARQSAQLMNIEMRQINLDPPQFMRDNAEQGLKYHEEGLSGDGLMPQTVEDARKMVAGEVTIEKWRKIAPWIARHMTDLDSTDGEITAGVVAHLLWGSGSTKEAAQRTMDYAQNIIDKLDEELEEEERTVEPVRETRWVIKNTDESRKQYAFTNLELRTMEDADDGFTVTGYAAVFDSPSEPLPWTEFVKRGAFRKTIKDGADVRLLIDHTGVPLARTKSKTLTLREDDKGLYMEARLDPANPDAVKIRSALMRGDVSQMSFAFETVKDGWNQERTVRELKEVRLHDVSIVTYPAYEQTSAEMRNTHTTDTPVDTVQTISLRKAQIALARARAAR